MKKILVVLAVALFVFGLADVSIAATLAGSKHDFTSGGSGAIDGDTLCAACHVPHTKGAFAGAPLWSRATSNPATYTLYSSDTLYDSVVDQPGDASIICLSCHDGTKAIGDVAAGLEPENTGTYLGMNLSSMHPIGVDIRVRADYKTATVIDSENVVELFADKVECGSCHDI